MGRYTDTTLSDAGEIIGNGKVVVLKPETWVGKRFPLLGHIDIGNELSSGLWVVLLHRHTCTGCQDALSKWKPLARDFSGRLNCPKVALVECPPYARQATTAEDGSLITGRLGAAKEWQLSGATTVLIDGGKVQSVFTDGREVELAKAIWGDGGN